MSSLVFFWSSVIGFDLLMLAEYLYSRLRGKGLYDARDAWASISMYWGYVLVHILWAGGVYGLYSFLHQFALFKIEASWQTWLLLFFLEDFCFYVFHRTSHVMRLLWASHVNHHSSEQFNFSTAVRQTWTPFLGILFWLPLVLIGFPPEMILTMQAVSLLYQSLLHTRLFGRSSFFGWIFNTPSHHRVHHGTNPEYIDRNYAGVLIIWDRLFGSFEPERAPVRYGITRNINTYNPLRIAFHEYADMLRDLRDAKNPTEFLGFVFKHPGWKPGSGRGIDHDAAKTDGAVPAGDSFRMENNLSIILIHAFLLFCLVILSPFWFPIRNQAWLAYGALAIGGLMLLPFAATINRRIGKTVCGLLYLAALLVFPLAYPAFFVESRALTIFSAAFGVLTAFKVVSYLRGDRTARTGIFHLLYFVLFSPELNFNAAFRPARVSENGPGPRLVLSLLQLLAAAGILYVLAGGVIPIGIYSTASIPLVWYGASLEDWRFWILLGLKGITLYLFVQGWVGFYTAYFNLGGFRFDSARRSPLLASQPAEFWRNFNPTFARWYDAMLRSPARTGGLLKTARSGPPLAGFLFTGLCFEYFLFLAASEYRPGFALAFFSLQGMLVFFVVRIRSVFRRDFLGGRLRWLRPPGVVLNLAQLLLAAALFFYAWDGLFQ